MATVFGLKLTKHWRMMDEWESNPGKWRENSCAKYLTGPLYTVCVKCSIKIATNIRITKPSVMCCVLLLKWISWFFNLYCIDNSFSLVSKSQNIWIIIITLYSQFNPDPWRNFRIRFRQNDVDATDPDLQPWSTGTQTRGLTASAFQHTVLYSSVA